LGLTFEEWIKLTTKYWSWLSYSAALVITILLLIATGVTALQQHHSEQYRNYGHLHEYQRSF